MSVRVRQVSGGKPDMMKQPKHEDKEQLRLLARQPQKHPLSKEKAASRPVLVEVLLRGSSRRRCIPLCTAHTLAMSQPRTRILVRSGIFSSMSWPNKSCRPAILTPSLAWGYRFLWHLVNMPARRSRKGRYCSNVSTSKAPKGSTLKCWSVDQYALDIRNLQSSAGWTLRENFGTSLFGHAKVKRDLKLSDE